MLPGSYVYLGKRERYGLIRNNASESSLLLKIKKPNYKFGTALKDTKSMDGHEEIEVDINNEDIRTEVEVKVRVIVSEDKRFTLTMKRPSNDKMKTFADDLGDLLNLSRYALSFFYKGD